MNRDFKNHVCAVDFDGTLCEMKWPSIGAPRQKIIDYVKNLQQEGWYLILWTNREGDYLDQALAWCKEYGLKFDTVNENIKERREYYGNDIRKVGANLYIDDLSVNPDNLIGCHKCDNHHGCDNCYYGQVDYKDYDCDCSIGDGGELLGWTPLGDRYCRNCGRKLK